MIDRILEEVSDGVPLAEVLRGNWAPHPSTFYDWLNDDPRLDRRFARAREIGHDSIAARTRRIARGEEGSSKDVKRDRLIVDTDLKLLEKWDRRYGNRVQTAQTDTDGNDVTVPPNTDVNATLGAYVAVLLARDGLAKERGWSGEHTREQMAELTQAHPWPDFVPHSHYRERPQRTIELRALPAPADPPDDGSDLA